MVNFRTFLACPKVCLGLVDVRDVAKAHVLALEKKESNGHRILITHKQPVWFSDIIEWITKEFKSQGFIPTPLNAPNWLIKLYAKTGIDKMSSALLYRLGPQLRFSNQKVVFLIILNANLTYYIV